MEMAGVSYPMERTKQSNCGTSGKWCPMLIGTLNKSKYKSIPFSLSTNINSYTTWKECSCLFFCFAPLFILNTLTYIHACPNKLICGMRRCICWDTDLKGVWCTWGSCVVGPNTRPSTVASLLTLFSYIFLTGRLYSLIAKKAVHISINWPSYSVILVYSSTQLCRWSSDLGLQIFKVSKAS